MSRAGNCPANEVQGQGAGRDSTAATGSNLPLSLRSQAAIGVSPRRRVPYAVSRHASSMGAVPWTEGMTD